MTKIKHCTLCGQMINGKVWRRANKPYCIQCSFVIDRKRARITEKTRKIKKSLIKIRGEACERCGAAGQLHAHHVIPVVRGGETSAENLELLCPSCHQKEHKVRSGIIR